MLIRTATAIIDVEAIQAIDLEGAEGRADVCLCSGVLVSLPQEDARAVAWRWEQWCREGEACRAQMCADLHAEDDDDLPLRGAQGDGAGRISEDDLPEW